MHMRNPGEKPLIAPVEIEVVAKPKVKQPKKILFLLFHHQLSRRKKDNKNTKEENGTVKDKPIEVDESKLMDIKTKKNNDDCYHASNVMVTY
ncbi:hypothetical protein Tco_1103776 [Tanacetum coccineum]